MAQLKVSAGDFSLVSEFACKTLFVYYCKTQYDAAATTSVVTIKEPFYQAPNTASKTVRFMYELPEGEPIKSAKVCASVGIPRTPMYDTQISTIAGVWVNPGSFVAVDVELTPGANYIDVVFTFKTKGEQHVHVDGGTLVNQRWASNGWSFVHEKVVWHESSLSFKDVNLLIEYGRDYTPPELVPYTDPYPIKGETHVKAVHMTELHTNANRVRLARGLGVYDFTRIASLTTYLSGWNAHVLEIREALDETGIPHEAWLPLGVNVPRLDVLLQLRRVVRAVAGIPDDGDTTAVELIVDAEGNGTITCVVWSVDDAGAATMTGATLYVGTNGAATIGTIAVGMTVDAEGNATITGAALPVDDAGAATMTGVALNVETDGAATIG